MDQQMLWPPLHFLNYNTILWPAHTPQDSELTVDRVTAATSHVVATSCLVLWDNRNFLSERVSVAGGGLGSEKGICA